MGQTSLNGETFPTPSFTPILARLVLASGSPRRAEILRSVGWPFTTVIPEIDESRQGDESPVEYVKRLALAKAEAVALNIGSPALVLAADTTVVVGNQILGKPRDVRHAREMLTLLNGRTHEVVTGVALLNLDARHQPSNGRRDSYVAHEVTRVRFTNITDAEIAWYAESGEPMDKAGGYAAQGRAALFIESIEGDYWNVVGLPIHLVYKLAKQMWQCLATEPSQAE